ncbi:hypothetical protein SDC9_128864 [bioreactor metagenome]|uniref:Uncharacterized protein n=1 Tax=bioreactor metagenome TaxID=1076179 RepID=A0A645CY27_9ZZZZ
MLSRAEHMYFRKSEHTRAGKRHALESRMIAAEPAGGDGGESGIELTFGKLPARLREVFLSPTLFVMIAYFLLKAAEFL